MQESFRTRRVAELLKQEIAGIIANEIHDPAVHDVVITSVEVTKDLDMARVYFTTYNKSDLEAIKGGLTHSSGFIHRLLTKSLHMRKIPRPEFIIDNSSEEGSKIDELLKQI